MPQQQGMPNQGMGGNPNFVGQQQQQVPMQQQFQQPPVQEMSGNQHFEPQQQHQPPMQEGSQPANDPSGSPPLQANSPPFIPQQQQQQQQQQFFQGPPQGAPIFNPLSVMSFEQQQQFMASTPEQQAHILTQMGIPVMNFQPQPNMNNVHNMNMQGGVHMNNMQGGPQQFQGQQNFHQGNFHQGNYNQGNYNQGPYYGRGKGGARFAYINQEFAAATNNTQPLVIHACLNNHIEYLRCKRLGIPVGPMPEWNYHANPRNVTPPG